MTINMEKVHINQFNFKLRSSKMTNNWLSETFKEIDKSVRELAYKNVVEDLEKEGISVNEIDEEDLKELVAEEVKKIKTFGKG